jgi:hypothetical protein
MFDLEADFNSSVYTIVPSSGNLIARPLFPGSGRFLSFALVQLRKVLAGIE